MPGDARRRVGINKSEMAGFHADRKNEAANDEIMGEIPDQSG